MCLAGSVGGARDSVFGVWIQAPHVAWSFLKIEQIEKITTANFIVNSEIWEVACLEEQGVYHSTYIQHGSKGFSQLSKARKIHWRHKDWNKRNRAVTVFCSYPTEMGSTPYPKFVWGIDTDETTHTRPKCTERLTSHIMRLSVESRASPKLVQMWLEQSGKWTSFCFVRFVVFVIVVVVVVVRWWDQPESSHRQDLAWVAWIPYPSSRLSHEFAQMWCKNSKWERA